MLVLNNFMENLLGLLSDMDKAEVRIPIKLYTWNIHGCRIKYSLNTYLIFAGPMTVCGKQISARAFENKK